MRVWLKTMIKRESRRWRERSFPSAEDALLHWLSLPLSGRLGGLLHEESHVALRNPRDKEVPIGILVTTEPMAHQLLRHRLRTKPQPPEFNSRYPRVEAIHLGGRIFAERDVLDAATVAEVREALSREGEIPQVRFRGQPRPGPSGRPPEPPRREEPPRPEDPDVVDAEWSEIASPDAVPHEAEAPKAGPSSPADRAAEAPPAGVDVPGYRGALAICAGLSPASGRAYRATCDEAFERFEEFLSIPAAGKARNAARAAHALLHALPRHFPSAEAAGRWAMVARPAIGAFAEGAIAWAASVSPAALTHRPAEAAAPAAPAGSPPTAPDPSPAGPEAASDQTEGPVAASDDAPVADWAATVGAEPSEAAPPAGAEPVPVEVEAAVEAASVEAPAAEAPPAPRRRRPAGGADRPVPVPGPSPVAAAPAEPGPAPAAGVPGPAGRRLTPTERKVVQVMERRVPMRKHEIAAKAGIGRGSANRIVDRLVEAGVCLMPVPLRYVLGPGARR